MLSPSPLPFPHLNEPEALLSWRRSLEQSLLPPPLPPAPTSTFPPTPSPHSPSAQSATPDRGNTPQPKSPITSSIATTNGNTHSATKEDDQASPQRPELKSPIKSDNEGLLPLPPSLMQSPNALMSGTRIPKSDPMEGALQDMLRYNMEKYAGQALDTLGAARRVRELLSVHNIGQRLFAKYVLGLSQGTVSELLSKPKCWEKLTEKGRDSYRKMHAWAYDDNAILLLKSLIPRKGELSRPSRSLFMPPDVSRNEFTGELNPDQKTKVDSFMPPRYPPFPGDGLANRMPYRLPIPMDKVRKYFLLITRLNSDNYSIS